MARPLVSDELWELVEPGDHVVHAFALRGAVDLGQTEDRPPEPRAWAEPLEQVLLDVIL